MKDTGERIELMHRRTRELRHKRERTTLIMSGGSCMVLFVALMEAVMNFGGGMLTAGAYTGTMLLSENAGGYVIVAVMAFMAGVAVTVFLRERTRAKRKRQVKERQNGEG